MHTPAATTGTWRQKAQVEISSVVIKGRLHIAWKHGTDFRRWNVDIDRLTEAMRREWNAGNVYRAPVRVIPLVEDGVIGVDRYDSTDAFGDGAWRDYCLQGSVCHGDWVHSQGTIGPTKNLIWHHRQAYVKRVRNRECGLVGNGLHKGNLTCPIWLSNIIHDRLPVHSGRHEGSRDDVPKFQ